MTYLYWALLLIIQNMSFTWISRARNSGSYSYHAVAALFSNGIYIGTFFLTVGNVLDAMRKGSLREGIALALIYTVSCMIGSVLMHYISMEYLEVGKRKVGVTDTPVSSAVDRKFGRPRRR